MSSQRLQQKQQFLLKEILQQDYDPEQFQQFMANQKGLDLDQYSMSQLRSIVRQFKGSIVIKEQEINDGYYNKNSAFIESQLNKISEVNTQEYQDAKNKESNIKKEQQKKKQNEPKKTANNPLLNNNKPFITNIDKSKQQKPNNALTAQKKPKINLRQMIIPQFKGPSAKINSQKQQQIKPNEQKLNQKASNNQTSNTQQTSVSPPTVTNPFVQPQNIAKLPSRSQQILKSLQPITKINEKISTTNNNQKSSSNSQKYQFQKAYQQKRIPQIQKKKSYQEGPFSTKKSFLKQDQQDEQQIHGTAFIGGNKKDDTEQYTQSVKQSTYVPAYGKNLYSITKKMTSSLLYRQIKSQKGFLDTLNIKINTFSKKQSTSLFRFSYITYHIETTFITSLQSQKMSTLNKNPPSSQKQTKKWKVQRRFNDFKWLYEYLVKYYVGLTVPPIPTKTKMRSFDDQHLQQRMVSFQRFLNKCIRLDQIASDPIFESFLSIQSREQLQAVKKKYQNKLKTKDENMLQYLKGQQIFYYKQNNNSIPAKIKSNISQTNELLIALNNELRELEDHLTIASKKAISANNIFRELSQINRNSSQTKGAAIFDLMGQFVGQIGHKLDNQAYYLKNYVQNIWMYEQKYNENILNKINNLQRNKTALQTKFKEFSGINQSNQGYRSDSYSQVSSQNSSKGSQQYRKTKQLYQIHLSLTLQQISRHQNQDLSLVSKQFLSGIGKYVNLIKDEMMTGVDFVTKAMTIAQGKQLKQVELISNRPTRKRSQERIAIEQQ